MNEQLIALVTDLYTTESQARGVLMQIGYPPGAIPQFEDANTFWPPVLGSLDRRVPGGTAALLKVTRRLYPGLSGKVDLLAAQIAAANDVIDFEPPGSDTVAGLERPRPGRKTAATGGGTSPPPGDAAVETSRRPEGCPTLTLIGADKPVEFEAVVRERLGTADLIYVAEHQSAVEIADPGERDEEVRRQVQDRMRAGAPDCTVAYRRYAFRPYLYSRLLVHGPDTLRYKMDSVPSTSTPEDVAAAIITETYEANVAARGRLVRAVVDHDSAETGRRLDPFTTLHECGVRDGDRLRVAPEAIAGSLSPFYRMEALLRAADQIRGYAAGHGSILAIIGYDDEELPERIDLELTATGLVPPDDRERYPEGSDWADLEDFSPRITRKHRVTVQFPPMFPLAAPEIVWQTPLFHPNVRATFSDGTRAGILIHPFLLGFRPEYDLANVPRVLIDVVTYRDYDLSEEASSPNPLAALWAASDAGQIMIKAIGGRALADLVHAGEQHSHPSRLLRLQPLRDESHEI